MSYYPTSPQSNEDPRVSQGRLLANFGKMNSDFTVNHQPLTTSRNAGYHTQIQFPDGVSDPNLNAPVSSLYPKLVSGLAELFFQNDVTANDIYQLTGVTPTISGNDYSFVTPWHIQIQMGRSTASPQVYALTFPVGFTLLTALGTPITGNSVRIIDATSNAAQFTYSVSAGNIFYLVIGLIP